MNLDQLRMDCAAKQKKGLHFILASILIWIAITAVNLTSLPVLTKNLLTFCSTGLLMPLSYFISRIIKADFTNKGNPLTRLGILISLNQLIYLLIVMWAYSAVPGKMVMILAIIFGAHLLPFSWLYQSKSYMILSIIIPITALAVGIYYSAAIVASVMVFFEIIFSILLNAEVKKLPGKLSE